MDWIKVLNKHILFEYNDLRDSEFAAWIKIMALTASLEREPTREQMLQYVHYKTLDSLQEKLNKHSIDLQYILNKVLIDVQYVSNRREALKKNTQRYRERNKPVINDVMITSCIREDKIREDKNITPLTPRKRGMVYADDFLTFWKAYPKKVGKDAAWRAWKSRTGTRPPVAELVTTIEKQTQSDQWQKENGQFIPNPATWLNQGRWADETAEQSSIDAWVRSKQADGTI